MNHFLNKIKNKAYCLKDLGSIGIADILGNAISASFWFYLATLLEPEQYGEIHYLISIAGIVQLISLIGTQNTITVYIAKNVKIQSTYYLISLIVGLISIIIIFFMFDRIDIGILSIGYIISILGIASLLGKKLYMQYAKYVFLQKVLTFILGISFFYGFGLDGIILGLALSYVPFMIIIYKEFREVKVDFSLLKPRVGFTINNYFMNLSSGFGGQIDKLLIAPLLGYAILGNYSLALQFYSILIIFSTIAFKYMLPEDASGKNRLNLKKSIVFLSIGIALSGWFVSPAIIPIIFPKFVDVIEAIKIISFVIIPETITLIFVSKFLSLEKSKFVLFGTVVSLVVSVSGIILLGTIYGIIGLSIALLLGASSETITLIIANRKINDSYDK